MTTPSAPGSKHHTQKLLATLNAYRERRNLKPLKSWKESRAKLEAAVDAIPIDRETPVTIPITKLITADEAAVRDAARKLEAANDADPTPKTEEKKKPPKPAKVDTTGTRTVPELCRAVGKKEKVGRAKCRRHGAKLRPLMIAPKPLGQDQEWRFDITNLAKVCGILGWEVPTDWK